MILKEAEDGSVWRQADDDSWHKWDGGMPEESQPAPQAQQEVIAAAAEPKETSSWMSRLGTGMADPIFGASQLVEKTMPDSWVKNLYKMNKGLYKHTGGILGREQPTDEFLSQREKDYQSRLPEDEGIDEARILGNVATTLAASGRVPVPTSLGGAIAMGGAEGAATGAAAPVTDASEGDYWNKKGKQAVEGAMYGAPGGVVSHGIGKVISPAASKNEKVREMINDGIPLTPGQAAGGVFNDLEQKATSIPLMGKKIADRRQDAQTAFNKKVLNKVVEPVGGHVDDVGHVGMKQAQDIGKQAYKNAEEFSPGFVLDDAGNSQLTELVDMVKYLPESEAKRFIKFYNDKVASRFSEAGGITSKTYKQMTSDIAKIAGNAHPEAETAGGALKRLSMIFKETARRVSPEYAELIRKADKVHAGVRTVEGAVNKGSLKEGVFTPGQLLTASKTADKTVAKNRSARGEGMLQDYASNAQKVLGNTVPDSGTAGRTFLGGGGLGYGMVDPMSVAVGTGGLFAGSQIYNPKVMGAVRKMITERPESAGKMAESLFNISPQMFAAFQEEEERRKRAQ